MKRWFVLVLACAGLPSCYPSNVLEDSARAVTVEEIVFDESAATPVDASFLVGEFDSVRIDGPAAAGLLRLHYFFAPSGRYTGAALVLGDDGPEYQTLTGAWRLDGETLLLDETALVARRNEDRLRIETEGGSIVMDRRRE